MNYVKFFYNKTFKYSLLNKFLYLTPKNLPKFNTLLLGFNKINSDMKCLSSMLLVFSWVAHKKGIFFLEQKSNFQEKNLLGCCLTLKRKSLFLFLKKVICVIFSQTGRIAFENQIQKNKCEKKVYLYFFSLLDIFVFTVLQNDHYLFYNLPKLLIKLNFKCKYKKEFTFFFKSLKIKM